ncbi:MAG: response regulator, partial [Alphaproteobacteria bacterium]
MSHDIILVDDEEHLRTACAQAFELAGLSVVAFESAEAALENIGNTHPGIVVTDVKMAGMGGLQLLATTQERDPQLPVILITGHGDIPTAVKAMQDGAYDFLEKPFASDRLVDISRRALELRRLVLENRALRDEITTTDSLERLVVGRTPPMVRLR